MASEGRAMTVSLLLLAVLRLGTLQEAAPQVDHHQHLFSPAAAALVSTSSATISPILAADLVTLLDAAGIRQAAVFSVAYTYGHVSRNVDNEYEKVKAENDWTSQQVAQFPDRLRAFCSFNPLKDYALEELSRCLKDPRLRRGLKLHFGNADVNVHDQQHVERLREVFRRANQNGMAIVVHTRSSISRKRPYGAEEARIFLKEIVPAAPDVPVQIAHLAGGGGYDDPLVDQAMSVYTDAISAGDARTKRLYFDVTSVAREASPERAALAAQRIRQLGIERVLYGSDAAAGGNPAPREGWAEFRTLPLTDNEFETIAKNVAPYMR
jgi:uncharacterized protein